jgi:hypothetical protein
MFSGSRPRNDSHFAAFFLFLYTAFITLCLKLLFFFSFEKSGNFIVPRKSTSLLSGCQQWHSDCSDKDNVFLFPQYKVRQLCAYIYDDLKLFVCLHLLPLS